LFMWHLGRVSNVRLVEVHSDDKGKWQ